MDPARRRAAALGRARGRPAGRGPARPGGAAEGEGFGASIIYTGGTTGKPKGALRRGINPQDLMDTLGALDLLDPAHVHLVAGPMYHSAPGGLALYTHLVGGTVVDHAEVRPGAGSGPDRAAPLQQHLHGPDPAQAHRGPARGGAGALRRVLDARHHHGGGAVPDAREGGRGGPLRARALRVLRLERARGEHGAAAGGRAAQAGLVRAGGARQGDRAARRRRPPGADRASRASSTCGGSPASSTSTIAIRTRPRRCAAATGTRSATWPTWTRTASTTSATASAT